MGVQGAVKALRRRPHSRGSQESLSLQVGNEERFGRQNLFWWADGFKAIYQVQ